MITNLVSFDGARNSFLDQSIDEHALVNILSQLTTYNISGVTKGLVLRHSCPQQVFTQLTTRGVVKQIKDLLVVNLQKTAFRQKLHIFITVLKNMNREDNVQNFKFLSGAFWEGL